MKLFSKVVLGLTFGLLALTSTSASALNICNTCNYLGNATYLGSHDPTTGDASNFGSGILPDGTFTQYWLFGINPGGDVEVNASFVPSSDISNFDVLLYNVSLTGGAPGAAGTLYGTSYTQGSLVGDGVTGPNQFTSIAFTSLASGFYLFKVTGLVTDVSGVTNDIYSGNLTTRPARVPEPASLGLMGFGLMAAAAALRRRRQRA
jgi:hypothetical protein